MTKSLDISEASRVIARAVSRRRLLIRQGYYLPWPIRRLWRPTDTPYWLSVN